MAITSTDLAKKVGASPNADQDALQSIVDTAGELVTDYVGDATIPTNTLDRAHLLVAEAMYRQDQAPNGIVNQQYDDGGASTPIRIGRDPMSPAYPLLTPFLGAGLA